MTKLKKNMSNVHTLRDIEDRGADGFTKVNILPGRRLGSIRESELEKALHGSIKTASDIANEYKDLQNVCLKQKKDLVLVQANASKKISQLNATNTRLRSSEQLSRTEHKAERANYSAEIKLLKSEIKTLKKKETLTQKASSLDKIKILSLEAKISELEGKLENLELEQVFHDSNINGGILEELGKQEDLKLPDWIDENLKGFVYELGLENKVKEIEKKIAKEDLLEVLQKALSERNSLIQEANLKGPTNACLAEQIPKTSSESEVHGGADSKEKPGVSEQEKDNSNTSPETTWVHNANVSVVPETCKALANEKSDSFFQQYFVFFILIILLIIYFLWRISSYLHSFNSPLNEEKNLSNYKIPLNRNYSYGFPIRYTEEPKDRTTPYETLPYGYG